MLESVKIFFLLPRHFHSQRLLAQLTKNENAFWILTLFSGRDLTG